MRGGEGAEGWGGGRGYEDDWGREGDDPKGGIETEVSRRRGRTRQDLEGTDAIQLYSSTEEENKWDETDLARHRLKPDSRRLMLQNYLRERACSERHRTL